MKAWHFTNKTLRDGSPIPAAGETLRHTGPLALCELGLHASTDPLDALRYVPGSLIHRVECGGEILRDSDKICCSERTILWSADATETLRHFARLCALDVIHLWDAPEIVVWYLRTGDEAIRDAASDAAWATVGSVARATVWNAARAAALAADARAAAGSAACDSARAAGSAAARSEGFVARDAARDAARAAQSRRLTRMLRDLRREAV